nr:kinesin-like protein KIN-1 [Tanacetum cinerariifolium]GFC89120.1 kinesin-like protein KIN-1 [Tanacetum cinerariifolium]
MAHISVGTRFSPLNSKIDDESFTLKDEKDEQYVFSFDKVFYEDSEQAERLMRKDVLKNSETWTDFHDESPVIAVEVERLIFRDLVNEIVMSEVFDDKPGNLGKFCK